MPKSGTRLGSIVPLLLAGEVLLDGCVFTGGVLEGCAFAGEIVVGGPLLPGLLLPGLPKSGRCGKASAVASRARNTAVSFMLVMCQKGWLSRPKAPACGVAWEKSGIKSKAKGLKLRQELDCRH